MPIVDLYSSRQRAKNMAPDVWEYERVPDALRVQVSNIIRGAFGDTTESWEYSSLGYFRFIRETVSHEHGIDYLNNSRVGAVEDVHACLRHGTNLLVWLDVVELACRFIERSFGSHTDHDRKMRDITIPSKEALEELNERFRRAGLGYRYESGSIIRVDSEFTHQEATRPALMLLSDPRFAGAEEEFRAAHAHYKAGEYKDCAVDALNALESTMKAICDAKKWACPKGARATDLVKILRRENLFPEFADLSFEQLFATLKSGLPALRNETGGHGQGPAPVEVPQYVAAYGLNLAASKIVFLVEAFKQSEK